MNEIIIDGRKIGPAHPPLVIAEIGINHNGCLTTAKKMVDAAARAGVEIIKHQTHIVEDEMSRAAKSVIPGNATSSIYDIMRECALSEDDERALKRYVEDKGMIFFSTPFSRAAANRLADMNVSAYKIGSGECNNTPLIQHVCAQEKPVILSTGMNNIGSIANAVTLFRAYHIPYALLHTTNLYPTPPHLVRLGAMTEMAHAFPDAVFGLSDHTTNNIACMGAIALGASIVERHFTDHMQREGPDIICSMDEHACRELIHDSKTLHVQLGGHKTATPEEKITMDFAFSTVVSIKAIQKGEPFNHDNIWVKRPGCGDIPAVDYESLIGKVAAQAIENDTHLKRDDIQA
ncbi:N-acetylneuraminate synthase family protein [Teredinibacter purpureus]|uniref:N-acetylneuraminate synthase family protein n=1 Tax=Teredinibacter purpureus TaxID=2731756 RepID=UPI0005F88D66|nr:N-acetylneuraminate synthase family protein [Teredinibacter purpureus]